MAGQIRQSRIATAIKKFVSTLMLSEYGDSPVSMITISKVTVMPDLRSAKIFYSTFDSGSVDKIQEYLDLKTKNIRFKLAGHLKTLKFAPEIKFVYDDTV
ncbi:MAG TPA: ribosome-binding factor A, partial [bacterium]|nr:ribosome-binding factor A [bacterium]